MSNMGDMAEHAFCGKTKLRR